MDPELIQGTLGKHHGWEASPLQGFNDMLRDEQDWKRAICHSLIKKSLQLLLWNETLSVIGK